MNVPLRDAQIERYSRQIVLPEIGGRGQERLLVAVVAIEGRGELAAIAARYLVGAGVGELRLGPALDTLGGELRRLNPEATLRADGADQATTALIAADLDLATLDACTRRARTLGVPLIAAGSLAGGGWLHVPTADAACAACAARLVVSQPEAAAVSVLAPVAAGVLGSLLALAALERALELPINTAPLQWFASDTSLLSPIAWTRAADCPAHATT